MKKRILSYRKKMDLLLMEDAKRTDWKDVLEEHLIQIGFFQHERLVHLLVTGLVAIVTIIIFCVAYIESGILIWVATFLLMILLVAYIIHYYLL